MKVFIELEFEEMPSQAEHTLVLISRYTGGSVW